MTNIGIQITGEFGSDVQDAMAKELLLMMLQTWRNSVNARHKKNQIEININDKPIQDINHIYFMES